MASENTNNYCGKVIFDTYLEAQKMLNKLNGIGRVYGKSKRRLAFKKPKQIYKCPDCGKYHLTTKQKK